MARLFDDAKSQYLENAAAVLSAVPITLAGWIYIDDDTVNQVIMGIYDNSVSDSYHHLIYTGASSDIIGATSRAPGLSEQAAATSTGPSLNTWHHVAGVFATAASRAAYIDGGSKGTNAVSRSPTGLDTTTIGRKSIAAPTLYFSGRIAEVGIWNAALTDDEIASLAKGASPLLVRPANLVAYWNLFGRSSPEPDIVGGFDMTLY